MVSLSVDTDIVVTMRDGVALRADVLRPAGPGEYPVVVFRTPYDRKTFASVSLQVHALGLTRAGYAVVLQDVRGRGDSGGTFEPFVNEQADGVDTIYWAAEQPWSDGQVATAGISYNAFSQIAAAAASPEPLAAWIPGLSPFDVHTSWIREGGALNYGFNLAWLLGVGAMDAHTPVPDALVRAFADPLRTAARGPADQPELAASPAAASYFRWLDNEAPYAGDPGVPGPGDLGGVRAPALVVAGWFDVFQPGSFELFETLDAESPPAGSALMAGPWDHSGLPFKRRVGDRDHGISALVDYHEIQLAWLDAHLRGGDLPVPQARIFVTGANEWEQYDSWPPPATIRAWDLNPNDSLGTGGRGGEVGLEVGADDPTPAGGGRLYPWDPVLRSGSFDQRPRETRGDVATFTSEPLEQPLRAIGEPAVETVVIPDTAGTDVVVTLTDVDTAGASWNVAEGVRRVQAAPGEPASIHVSLGRIAHEFPPGHRVRVTLSAAAFPRYDVFGGPGTRLFLLGPGYSRLLLPETT